MIAPSKPSMHRGSHLNFYNASNFSLSIPKKDKRAEVFLSYVIGDTSVGNSNYQVSTVLVSRSEAKNALKNFKKVLANSRVKV